MKYKTKVHNKIIKKENGLLSEIKEGKPRYDLIPLYMLKRWAELMERGSRKYKDENWRKADSVEDLNNFKARAWRHFIQYMNNEEDEDHAVALFFNISVMEHIKERIKHEKNSG